MSKSGLTKDRIFYEFDPFKETGTNPLKGSELRDAKEKIANFVKEQVLDYVGSGKTPVSGGAWKRTLSPEYKKIKAKSSSATFANMEYKGDLLDALDVSIDSGTKLSLEVTGSDQVAKADGHNNFSGKSDLPARDFIPKSGQSFKKPILDGIKSIIASYGDGSRDGKRGKDSG